MIFTERERERESLICSFFFNFFFLIRVKQCVLRFFLLLKKKTLILAQIGSIRGCFGPNWPVSCQIEIEKKKKS